MCVRVMLYSSPFDQVLSLTANNFRLLDVLFRSINGLVLSQCTFIECIYCIVGQV